MKVTPDPHVPQTVEIDDETDEADSNDNKDIALSAADEEEIIKLAARLDALIQFHFEKNPVQTLEYDKDEDLHLDSLHALANLRAFNYDI